MKKFSSLAVAGLSCLGLFVVANAQSAWTLRNPLPAFKPLHAVVAAGGQVVAVGDSGTVLTSVDGKAWTKRTPVVGTALRAVAASPSTLVAVGSAGVILTSTDQGATWVQRTSGVTAALFGVHWTGSVFVAVGGQTGGSGTILTSADGINWALRASNTSNALNAVTSSPDGLVAVGDGGSILTSPDGATWTLRTSGTSQGLYGVGWGGGLFIAVGNSGTIRTSPDGNTWSAGSSSATGYLTSARYGNGQYVIVGNAGAILHSASGAGWTAAASATTQAVNGVAWTGSLWVAVTAGGTIRISETGTSWTDPSSTISSLNAVAFRAGKPLVVVGDGGTIVTSSDSGKTWVPRVSNVSKGLYAAAWSPEICVVVGQDGTLLTSDNGATWTVRSSGLGAGININALAWTGSVFIAVADGGNIRTSPDGVVWNARTSNTSNSLRAVAWTGTQAVAVGMSGTIVTSPDGVQAWTVRQPGTPATTNFYAVTGNSELVVLAGAGGTIRTSPDGVTWTPRTSGVGTALYAVGWSGSLYTALTTAGTVLTSSDGYSWNTQATATNSSLYALAWPYNSIITVGTGGAIQTSPKAAVPDAPALASPSQGATGVNVFATLSWNASQGAQSYRVQVSLDTLFGTFVANDSVTGTSRTLPAALAATTKYYWRVNARNTVGASAFSAVRSFTTGLPPTDPPPAPVLVSPENFAQGLVPPVTLSWNASAGADGYQLQISTAPTQGASGFATTVLNDSGLTLTSRTSGNLTGGSDYYWQVRARNGLGWGAWSEIRNFRTVLAVPGVPELIGPEAFALDVNRAPTFSWSAVPGAQTYRLQVATNPAFTGGATVFDNSELTATSYKIPGNLPLAANTEHYWRVSAANTAGPGTFSAARRFTTGTMVALLPGERLVRFARFAGAGHLRFDLERPGTVEAKLYDARGKLLAVLVNEPRAAGSHSVALPRGLAPSLHFIEFRAPGVREWIKVMP